MKLTNNFGKVPCPGGIGPSGERTIEKIWPERRQLNVRLVAELSTRCKQGDLAKPGKDVQYIK